MSSNNDNGNYAGVTVAAIFVVMAAFGVFIFALVSFLVLLLTILALLAWNKRLDIGVIALDPDDARGLVYCGLAGMILLPLFVVFCQLLIGFEFNSEYWLYVFIGGYDLGANAFLLMPDDSDETTSLAKRLPDRTNQTS